MCDVLAPEKPGEKSYQELVKLIQDHLAPTPSEIVQRLKLNNRFRNEGESVAVFVVACVQTAPALIKKSGRGEGDVCTQANFVVALRNLAEHCEYRDTLNTMLRDSIVCGIRDEKIQ